MADIPADIYTEPKVDPDTLANLGPLTNMAGIFEGHDGVDIHPVEGDHDEEQHFLERYELQPIDPQTNGPQLLYGLRYHVSIIQTEESGTFHDQIGYWLWEPATETVTQTIAIPRAQVALASGHVSADATEFILTASRGATTYGICSSPFLDAAFRTTAFSITVTINEDGSWSYDETTVLEAAGRSGEVAHHDTNTLHRVEAPTPNLLMRLSAR